MFFVLYFARILSIRSLCFAAYTGSFFNLSLCFLKRFLKSGRLNVGGLNLGGLNLGGLNLGGLNVGGDVVEEVVEEVVGDVGEDLPLFLKSACILRFIAFSLALLDASSIAFFAASILSAACNCCSFGCGGVCDCDDGLFFVRFCFSFRCFLPPDPFLYSFLL